ncbi:uromodulin-like [Discoglossus pictus]
MGPFLLLWLVETLAILLLVNPALCDWANLLKDNHSEEVRRLYKEPWEKEKAVHDMVGKGSVFSGGCSTTSCDNGGVCRLVKGRHVCQCRPGFTGRYCEEVQLDLSCEYDRMRLTIMKSVLTELGVNTSLLHMMSPDCKLEDTEKDELSAVLTRDNHTSCGTTVQVNDTHLTYSNELSTGGALEQQLEAQGGGLISRSSSIKIKFSCVYRYDRVVSLPYPLMASASLVTFMVEEGSFNVSMTLHPTSAFLKTYNWQPVIPMSHRLYVQLQIHGHNPQNYFRLKLEQCWATPVANHSNGIRHPIITNGIANDSTVAIINSGNSSLTRFSMQMFHFISYPEIYLHCRIWLCQSNCSMCCGKNKPSNGRHVRDLNDPYRKLVSCGPIKLSRTKVSSIQTPVSGISQLVLPGSFAAAAVLLLLCVIAISKALKKNRHLRGVTHTCTVPTAS